MHRRWVTILVAALLTGLPSLAYACPVCFDPRETNRAAFFATTIFLSLLPLGLVAGVVLWLRHRMREVDRIATSELPSPDAA